MNLSFATRFGALTLALLAGITASAQTRINSSPNDPDTGKPPVKPAKEYVFVRGFKENMKDLEIVAVDSVLPKARWYGEQLKDFAGTSIDIVMQQCHSGGFIDNVNASRNDFSIATAADWYEVANGFAPLMFVEGMIKVKEMEDFTRPWWQDVFAGPNDGMKTHFNTALNGIAASEIAKDAFAPPGKQVKDKQDNDVLKIEHPQYASTGNDADNRKLKDNTYAVLVQWGPPDVKFQFEIEMARMYQALTDATTGGIPAKNIAVLFGNLNKGDMIGGQMFVDGTQVPTFAVSGPTTADNWTSALNGSIFGEDNKPGENARLFIYNNGHGGLQKQQVERDIGIASNGAPTTIFDVFLTNGFDVSPQPADPSYFGLTDPDGFDSIQIAATHDIVASQLFVNGMPFSLGLPLGVGDGIRHVEEAIDPARFSGDLVYYQLRVPHELLGTNPLMTRFEFHNLDDPLAIVAFDFAGGTQEMINIVPIPEPATPVLVALAIFALIAARRARKGDGSKCPCSRLCIKAVCGRGLRPRWTGHTSASLAIEREIGVRDASHSGNC